MPLTGGRDASHVVRRIVAVSLETVALFAFAVACASSFKRSDLVIGAAASVLGAIAGGVVARRELARFSPRWRWVAQCWRIPGYVLSGSWELVVALRRQLFTPGGAESLVRAVAFDAGSGDEASSARRALAVAYTTSTPNFVVIDVVREQGLLLFHQVKRGKVLPMTRRLGADV
jgi:hypothetical protein